MCKFKLFLRLEMLLVLPLQCIHHSIDVQATLMNNAPKNCNVLSRVKVSAGKLET